MPDLYAWRLCLPLHEQRLGPTPRPKEASASKTRANTKTEGGLRQPKTRAEKHTEKKKVLGLSKDRGRPPPAQN